QPTPTPTSPLPLHDALPIFGDLVGQLAGARESQRGQQPEPDRLTMAVAPICGGGLDRMSHGVAEVERGPPARIPLVGRDDLELQIGRAQRLNSSHDQISYAV